MHKCGNAMMVVGNRWKLLKPKSNTRMEEQAAMESGNVVSALCEASMTRRWGNSCMGPRVVRFELRRVRVVSCVNWVGRRAALVELAARWGGLA